MKSLPVLALALLLAMPVQAQLGSPNAVGVTFGHVHLNVVDLALHQGLWVEHFGGEPIQRGSLNGVKYPGMILFFSTRPSTGGSQGTVMDHFGFKVRDIEPMLAKWKASGYEVQLVEEKETFIGAEGSQNAYLMAPDGVRFELQEDPAQTEDVIAYHVHFYAPDFEDLLDWYINIFGAERFQRGTLATTANVPGMNLSFQTSEAPRDPTRARAIDHIGFEVDDLDAFARQIEAKGVQFEMAPRETNLGLRIAFLRDPSGVYIELTQGLDQF